MQTILKFKKISIILVGVGGQAYLPNNRQALSLTVRERSSIRSAKMLTLLMLWRGMGGLSQNPDMLTL